jgi:signal transduction histidine kinase/DICT domain-containing protein
MTIANALLRELVQEYPQLQPQMYFKSSLTALTRAMEDLVLAGDDTPLIIANFQYEQVFRQAMRRYQKIAHWTDHIYVLGVPKQESNWTSDRSGYEIIPLKPTDKLVQERHLVIIGQQYTACLVSREQGKKEAPLEQGQRFEGVWTFDRLVCQTAADKLLTQIEKYSPNLAKKVEQARQLYGLIDKTRPKPLLLTTQSVDLGIFTQRLITYLQASQYKLLKAYRVIAAGERKERLINEITSALRSSLNPQEVLKITVEKLGKLFAHCRCLLYRPNPQNTEVEIEYEYVSADMASLSGQKWSIETNPLFLAAQAANSPLAINDVTDNFYLQTNPALQQIVKENGIRAWLLVPIRYQRELLGMLELHYGGQEKYQWQQEDIALVEAIATQVGVALTQASAYTDLADLNEQLESIERIQSNLIAIVGHELRTPLSTIRIFLESLASEPDMPLELRTIMLETALNDTERLGQLIQDFLTLSKLETGKAYRRPEPVQISYAIDLALHRLENIYKNSVSTKPEIRVELPHPLPIVLADVEGLVEVLTKLLDNACKFTPDNGLITITAQIRQPENAVFIEDSQPLLPVLEVIIADTGKGIEPSQLEMIFDRFSQGENFLRRNTSGIGLGLAICRQIMQGMGGDIWAISEGKDQGSQFHFTVPIEGLGFRD